MEEIIKAINEVNDIQVGNTPGLDGKNRPGIMHVINHLMGYSKYDGYCVETTLHKYLLLIDNGQCCCESWGYFASNNDFDSFIGKVLESVEMTDVALNTKAVEESGYYDGECGGIQFVNFRMSDGNVLQFAVYNEHNGYYGHPIYFVKDAEILLEDCL